MKERMIARKKMIYQKDLKISTSKEKIYRKRKRDAEQKKEYIKREQLS